MGCCSGVAGAVRLLPCTEAQRFDPRASGLSLLLLLPVQAGLGTDALCLPRAARRDPGLGSPGCPREGEACTAASLSPGPVTSSNITLPSSFSLFLKEKQIQAGESDLQ